MVYIDSRPVLHVVDEATNYQAARWLSNVSADAIWQALRLCWIDVYVGPPDIITHDAGNGFTAGQFQASADMLRITTKGIPVESPQSMSTVERYHAPLRKAYNTIAADSPVNTDQCRYNPGRSFKMGINRCCCSFLKPARGEGGNYPPTYPMLRAVWQLFTGGIARKRQKQLTTGGIRGYIPDPRWRDPARALARSRYMGRRVVTHVGLI